MNKVWSFILLLPSLLFISKFSMAYEVGVGIHPDGYYGNSDSILKLIQKYHFTSFRVDYRWDVIEKEKGVFTPPQNKTEKIIMDAKKYNIKPLVILGYGNRLYGGGKPKTEESIAAYCNFAGWTARHFKGQGVIYEIWNEWSNRKDKGANDIDSAKAYVKLVKYASACIKRSDQSATIIAGSFNPLDYIDLDWGGEIVKEGILNYVDGLSIHPYTWGSKRASRAEFNIHLLDKTHDDLLRISGSNKNIDFYITEIGFPTNSGKPEYSEEFVASFAYKYIIMAKRMNYIKGVWWYDFINDGNNIKYREYNFGILNRDLSEKSIAPAIRSANQKIR
ncbi:TPA: hypothetical protein ACGPI0_001038 [Klebsiella pneumoniae]